MPVVRVTTARSIDAAAGRALIAALTDTVVAQLGVPRDVVSVILEPIPSDRWGVGGTPLADRGV